MHILGISPYPTILVREALCPPSYVSIYTGLDLNTFNPLYANFVILQYTHAHTYMYIYLEQYIYIMTKILCR
jgi:hypothetical protein